MRQKENAKDRIECSVQEDCEGGFLASAKICDVKSHYWAGFRVDQLLSSKRVAYLSDDTTLSADGMDHVTIKCAHQLNFSSPEPYTTIMTSDETVLSDRFDPKCVRHPLSPYFPNPSLNPSFPLIPQSTFAFHSHNPLPKLKRPKHSGHTFTFCSTNDAFLFYEID
nr:hypothetical protein HmN_000712400 [Hymenolepis microstoma]